MTEQRVGDYVLERELGRGGMGRVYAARHTALGRRVALKVLLSDVLESEGGDTLARFRREAEAVARLRHPGIVSVHEGGLHRGRPYLVMDLIEGRPLDAVLAEGPLEPARAARLVAEVASAVQHAHEQGILHRDVKPANVLLDAEERALLTDFGLARELSESRERLTRTGQMLGTPAYMPPEQADGRPDAIGPASDVYGLGALLYACLTGRPPFEGATAMNVVAALLSKPPTPPRALRPELDRALETVCLQALEKEPARRYASAADLADDLQRWLDGQKVLARRRTLRPVLAAGLAGFVLLVPVSWGLYAWRQRVAAQREARQQQEERAAARDAVERARADLEERRRAELAEAIQARDLPRAERAMSTVGDATLADRWSVSLLRVEAALKTSRDLTEQVQALGALPPPPEELTRRCQEVAEIAYTQLETLLQAEHPGGRGPLLRTILPSVLGCLHLISMLDAGGLRKPEHADLVSRLKVLAVNEHSPSALQLGEALTDACLGDLAFLRALGAVAGGLRREVAAPVQTRILRMLVARDPGQSLRWEVALWSALRGQLERRPPAGLVSEGLERTERLLARSDLTGSQRVALLHTRACALRSDGKLERALEAVQTAVGGTAPSTGLLVTRMWIHHDLGHWELAMDDAEALVACKRATPSLKGIVMCWVLRDRVRRGRERTIAAVASVAKHLPLQTWTWNLRRALLLVQAGRPQKAARVLRFLEELLAKRGYADDYRIRSLAQAQRWRERIQALRERLAVEVPAALAALRAWVAELEAVRVRHGPGSTFP